MSSIIPPEPQKKTCSMCSTEKPLSEFYKDKHGRLGHSAQCKKCFRQRQLSIIPIPLDQLPPTKQCRKCGQIKGRSGFGAQRENSDGLKSWCRDCQNAASRIRKQRPEIKARNRLHQQSEKAKQKQREYHQRIEVKERIRNYVQQPEIKEKRRQRRQKPEAREYQRKYYQRHSQSEEARVAYRKNGHNYRARKRNAEGSFTKDDILTMYKRQKAKCHWCKTSIKEGYHVDHIQPLSRGGSNWPWNLVLTCPHCNTSKQDRLPHELGWRLF